MMLIIGLIMLSLALLCGAVLLFEFSEQAPPMRIRTDNRQSSAEKQFGSRCLAMRRRALVMLAAGLLNLTISAGLALAAMLKP